VGVEWKEGKGVERQVNTFIVCSWPLARRGLPRAGGGRNKRKSREGFGRGVTGGKTMEAHTSHRLNEPTLLLAFRVILRKRKRPLFRRSWRQPAPWRPVPPITRASGRRGWSAEGAGADMMCVD
jgi:hypothetical protein